MLVAMTRRPLRRLTRDAEAPLLLESFFVAAVASFLGIRWFLGITGYPRIGSNGIHIAHMLWGGLLMLLALMLLLAFLDRWVQHLAAVIAGLGFGTFIDEIGKFVTSDNNYFFRPAIALIYGVFVVAFLVARVLVGQRRLTQTEALANALDLLEGSLDGPIEPDDRARIQRLLELADPQAPLAILAARYLADLPPAAERTSLVGTIRRNLTDGYEELMANPWAERALSVGVVAYAALAVFGVALVACRGTHERGGRHLDRGHDRAGRLDDHRRGARRPWGPEPARVAGDRLSLVPAGPSRLDPRHPGVRLLQLAARRDRRARDRPRRLRQPPLRHQPGDRRRKTPAATARRPGMRPRQATSQVVRRTPARILGNRRIEERGAR